MDSSGAGLGRAPIFARGGPVKAIHKILFIRTDRMGDVLMNLPAVRLLRQTYPKCWLTWMVDRSVAGLLKGHPDADEILEVDGAQLLQSALYRRRLMRQVRDARFDLAVASNSHKFFHWMMFRVGIRIRVGWRRKWGILLNRALPDDKATRTRHEVDSNLQLVGLVSSKKWDGAWGFAPDKEVLQKMGSRLAKEIPGGKEIIAVHAGTSDPAKRWGAGKFAQICRKLLQEGRYTPVLIGGSEEEAISREVTRECQEPVVDWTGALSLRELAAFLGSERVRTLVSSDSGPVHVAWIQQKPVVALFAKNAPGSDPLRWGPRSAGSVAIHKNIQDISADEVYSALMGVLS